MPEAYIGLGSNLGSQSGGIHKTPRDQINDAIEIMSKNPDISLIAISSYYQTSAIGPGEQPEHLVLAQGRQVEATHERYRILPKLLLQLFLPLSLLFEEVCSLQNNRAV